MKNINWLFSRWYVWLGLLIIFVWIVFALGANTSEEQPQVQEKTEELQYGYTEAQLREIYKEVVAAEDKATAESEAECPTNATTPGYIVENTGMCLEQITNLSEDYRLQVLDKYKLTVESWQEISMEAFRENWPFE